MPATELPSWLREGTSAPSKAAVCPEHGVARLVLMGAYHPSAGQGLFPWETCPRCALTDDISVELGAVWDGTTWRVGAEAVEPFRALYLAALAEHEDPPAAQERWDATTQVPGLASRGRLRTWAYGVAHPELGVPETAELLRLADRVLGAGAADPLDRDPASLRDEIEKSRVRWWAFFAAVWDGLAPATHDALAYLMASDEDGRLFSGRLELLPADAVADLDQVLSARGAGWEGEAVREGDLSAWGGRVNDYRFNDQIRSLAHLAAELAHPVPLRSPLVDPATRPRFGPRTDEVEAALRRVVGLTALERRCLRLSRLQSRSEGADRAWADAHWALHRRYSRMLLGWVLTAASQAFRPHVEGTEGVVWDAYLVELARGVLDDDQVAALGRDWEQGMAAADVIARGGPTASARALRLIDEGWQRGAAELAEAVQAGPDR